METDTPIMSMRERKREQRRLSILSSATELFRRSGYEDSTMKEIAKSADISPPTLYNYFPTKKELLLGLFWQAREDTQTSLDAVLRKDFDDASEAVTQLIYADMGNIRSQADKKLWREILSTLLKSHDAANDEFRRYKAIFEQCLRRMLTRLVEQGLLCSDLQIEAATDVLYAVAWNTFSRLISNEYDALEDTRPVIENDVRVVLVGWQCGPRKEAVTG